MNLEKQASKYDPKVAIGIVTYNARNYLPFCLNSLQEQGFKDYQILIVDNGSSDGTLSYLSEKFPHYKVVAHKDNIGFSKAFNQIISWTKSEYLFCVNQDTVLDRDYLTKAIDFLDQHSDVAGISGKLYKWDYQNNIKTTMIDSVGLIIKKNHQVMDRGNGEEDQGQYNQPQEVFGISGALPIYRRQALEDIKLINKQGYEEYFDESYFAYKEDVDLSWRLRLAGWKLFCLPQSIAYHDRTVAGAVHKTDWQVAIAHRKKNILINFLSYRNHLLTIYKNEFALNFWKYILYILPYEFKKYLFMKLFNRVSKSKFRNFWQLYPQMRYKRKQISKIIKVKPQTISKWYQ
ncbi:MAG: glycosyltransferase family 2 protein [Candidatus Komeilibacteria bacterium]